MSRPIAKLKIKSNNEEEFEFNKQKELLNFCCLVYRIYYKLILITLNMIKFKTKVTWVLFLVHFISFILIIFYIFYAFESWPEDKTKTLESLKLIGIIAEILGFVILLHPKIIRIFSKKESDLQYDGIGYVVGGLIIQAIAIHLSL